MEVGIPALSGKYVSKLGANQGEWQLIGHVTSSSTTFAILWGYQRGMRDQASPGRFSACLRDLLGSKSTIEMLRRPS
jgi:hypothetical protein